MTITIQINMPRQLSEGERYLECARNLAASIERGARQRIANEQARGNPLFSNINTWSDFVAALKADRARVKQEERKRLGFWRYHFGAIK